MPDNHEDVVRRHYLGSGGNHMLQQRATADLMQHFGALRFQPRALARGHDDDCELHPRPL
jgi:hypothetical protein